MNQEVPKWYRRKRYVIPVALIGFGIIAALGNTSPSTPVDAPASVYQAAQQNIPRVSSPIINSDLKPSTPLPTSPSNDTNNPTPLSNNNYYTNTRGDSVHAPAYAPSAPIGASAKCRDNTFSFSRSRRGTCSHHGGVAMWL